MARKRLSDLLREEAQKPDESTIAAAKESSEVNVEAIPPTPVAGTISEDTSRSREAMAELERMIAAANQRESELKQQLADLEADLKGQTASIQELQASLEAAEKRNGQLEAELAEAKQTALHLAEKNSQLEQKQSTPPQPTKSNSLRASVKPSQPLADSKLAPTASRTQGLTQQEILRRRQANSLAHPVFPSEKSPGHLSEQDLGWVD